MRPRGFCASAATIGQPEVLGPGTTLPINFAAFKEPADNKLPKNYRIVSKHIEITRGSTKIAIAWPANALADSASLDRAAVRPLLEVIADGMLV